VSYVDEDDGDDDYEEEDHEVALRKVHLPAKESALDNICILI
jgi:hypothetical protein